MFLASEVSHNLNRKVPKLPFIAIYAQNKINNVNRIWNHMLFYKKMKLEMSGNEWKLYQ